MPVVCGAVRFRADVPLRSFLQAARKNTYVQDILQSAPARERERERERARERDPRDRALLRSFVDLSSCYASITDVLESHEKKASSIFTTLTYRAN